MLDIPFGLSAFTAAEYALVEADSFTSELDIIPLQFVEWLLLMAICYWIYYYDKAFGMTYSPLASISEPEERLLSKFVD